MSLGVNNEYEQYKICEKIFDGVNDKIKSTNYRIDDLENKTQEINGINNTLARMEVLISLQREDSIKRDKTIDDMHISQLEITSTLKTLAESINRTDESVDKLDKKVDANNEALNRKFDIVSEDNIIKISDINKKTIFGVICGSVGVGVTIIVTKILESMFR